MQDSLLKCLVTMFLIQNVTFGEYLACSTCQLHTKFFYNLFYVQHFGHCTTQSIIFQVIQDVGGIICGICRPDSLVDW